MITTQRQPNKKQKYILFIFSFLLYLLQYTKYILTMQYSERDIFINTAGKSQNKFSHRILQQVTGARYVTFYGLSFVNAVYNINSNNNVLYWTDNTGTNLTTTINEGYYSIDQLITEINYQLANTAGKDVDTYQISKELETSTVVVSNKLVFTASTGMTLRTGSSSILETLGFDTIGVSSAILTADNIYDLSQDNLFLEHDLNVQESVEINNQSVKCFPILLGSFGDVARNGDNQYRYTLTNESSIGSITFRLLDKDLNEVTNNGVDFRFYLRFT